MNDDKWVWHDFWWLYAVVIVFTIVYVIGKVIELLVTP